MNRTLTIAALGVALTTYATDAHAQMQWTDKAFANVSIGVQAPSQTLTSDQVIAIYTENTTVGATQDVAGGALFDIAGGYKVWRNLAVGVGYTRVSSTGDLAVHAEIPDPLFTDVLRPVSTIVTNAKHTQQAIHLTGTWMMPVTDKIDVGFQVGPTIFLVSQELPGDFQFSEPGPQITSTTLVKDDKTTVGFHLGVDGTYLITPRYGVGVLVRYSWGSADLGSGSESLTLGGLQIGAGVRVRF